MNLLNVSACSVQIGEHTLVQPLSLRLAAGELLGLIGPNGAGKSTLIKAIAQLLPYRGTMQLQNAAMETLTAQQRARQLAYLSQNDPVHWPIAVQDLVSLGRHPFRGSWWRGAGQLSAADDAAVETALRVTDVWALRQRRFTELSGGERARVRLARVLAVNAPLLLADEPFAALDPRHQLQVMALLREQCQRGASVILVLHNLTLASRFCDRLLLLNQGKLVASGTPSAVLNAENLRRVYGIEAVTGEHAQQRYLVPWMCATD
ncbi:ABC transporter ATP-binding protein [Chromatium okenii]|uniref:ABC transporter ATP-binding protein n=1 Tax=Chromatium okenii TaxID=61644 RepID=UPI0026ED5824|nr:ABC transporter ATP-binding protein [Chromatium okenii]MBV5308723.1 ABC transporter ATP-binding protein [Chromatium okenii]